VSRATKVEMDTLSDAVLGVARGLRGEGAGFTLRQLFYRCSVANIVEKTEADYKRLARLTGDLRREGALPFEWLIDGTRMVRQPAVFDGPVEALHALADQYNESPWAEAEEAPEIWLEKDALAGVVLDATWRRWVPLRVMRGYASLTALHSAAQDAIRRARRGTDTVVYQLGDFDPSGQDAMRAARAFVASQAPGCVRFVTLGLSAIQVAAWNLPTRPTKVSDSRARKHGGVSVELDAMTPTQLVGLVSDAIDVHLPQAAREAHQAEIDSVRDYLRGLADATEQGPA
jgi:hypothetical protein